MAERIEETGTAFNADVLIIGGGFGGLAEVLEGRGPIYIDIAEYSKSFENGGIFRWDRPHSKAFFACEFAKMKQYLLIAIKSSQAIRQGSDN